MSRVTFDVVDHLFVVVRGCGPHDTLSNYLMLGCMRVCLRRVLLLSRVTSDVVNHVFVMVLGVVPMINLCYSLAIFCSMYCVPVGGVGDM